MLADDGDTCGLEEDLDMMQVEESWRVEDGMGAMSLEEGQVHQPQPQQQEQSDERKKSYRDMLLSAAAAVKVELPATKRYASTASTKPPWQPRFEIVNTPYLKVDRLYGQLPDLYVDADDEDGLWGLIDSVSQCKFATSVARARCKTMLTPLQLEKKTQRINEKSAQQ